MGANQGKEDETPTSPKSPRVSPVDIASGDETPVPALLDKQDAVAVTQRELAATRNELSQTQQQLEKMMELLERVAAKVKA